MELPEALLTGTAYADDGSAGYDTDSGEEHTRDDTLGMTQRIQERASALLDAKRRAQEAQAEYDEAMAALAQAQSDVDTASKHVEELRESLASCAELMYKHGGEEGLARSLLDAGSIGDFLTQWDSLRRVSQANAQLVQEAEQASHDLQMARDNLEQQRQQARERLETTRQEMADMGMNPDAPTSSTLLQNPCPEAWESSGFGYRDFDSSFHQGLDLAAAEGTPYYAAESGVVVSATNDGGYNGGAGNWVVIAHGGGLVTKYMHSSRTLVEPGQTVARGQHIGDIGETGQAFGAHLHFQVEVDGTPVNPLAFIG